MRNRAEPDSALREYTKRRGKPSGNPEKSGDRPLYYFSAAPARLLRSDVVARRPN
jgi:hypothetical protein